MEATTTCPHLQGNGGCSGEWCPECTPEHRAAIEIVDNMSLDDRDSFTRTGWNDGISAMLVDEWARLDLGLVLDSVEGQVHP